MIVYHGTTFRRAQRICADGFRPRKPSRRVWFAESWNYALGRARTQARRAHDRPTVLTCDIDLDEMRKRLGRRKVFHASAVIAIDGPVPVHVLRSYPSSADQPTTPGELASWVNDTLGLKPHKGVTKRDAGIERLSRWVVNRMAARPERAIRPTELLAKARQWLPEFFEGVVVDPKTFQVRRPVSRIEVKVEPPAEPADTLEDQALDCLLAESPKRRTRGLALLAELGDPDLFDWCAMFLGDASVEVRVAALHTVLSCRDADPEVIAPFADSRDKRVRAAATAALAKHGGARASYWFERGLKDPEPCVRAETAALLSEVDPATHQAIFELALNDPNPIVAHLARKRASAGGYARKWYWSRPAKS